MMKKIIILSSFLLISISANSQSCTGQPDGTPCDDGNACTINDQCVGGVCAGTPIVCDDGNPCTDDLCNPATGCVYTPSASGTPCDDGDACTINDQCVGGVCAGTPIDCDDGNPNTNDSCDPVEGCINELLPVELVYFNAEIRVKGITLTWQTVSELNNLGFEIQKSIEGREWQIIDFVEGKGTTSEIIEYQHQDVNPFFGTNYYRLKQIDYNRVFEYSNVIVVEYNNSEKNILVFPNPSKRLINVQIDNPSNQRMKVKIIDNLGRKIWESKLIEDESNWRTEIEIERNGIYFISAQIGEEIFYERVLING